MYPYITRPLRASTANKLLVWSETNTSLGKVVCVRTVIGEREKKGACAALFVVPFPNGADPVALGDLLPLGHGLARCARVVSAHVAALRTGDELLRGREVGKACVVYRLPEAQGVVRDL